MVQYYYDKFTSIQNNNYTYDLTSITQNQYAAAQEGVGKGCLEAVFNGSYAQNTILSDTVYKSFSISNAGAFVGSGAVAIGYSSLKTLKAIYEEVAGAQATGATQIMVEVTSSSSGKGFFTVELHRGSTTDLNYRVAISKITTRLVSTTYSKGSLVQSNIAAEDGTYPSNGRHSDGYWYVKGAAVGPLGPGVITNLAYSKVNFGDKITRLSNGWLVAAAKQDNTEIFLFKSMDGGVSWTPLCSVSQGAAGSIGTYAIASNGTKVYVAVARLITNNTVNYTVFDALTVQNTRLTDYTTKKINLITLVSVSEIQIHIDPRTQHIHVAYIATTSSPGGRMIFHAVSIDSGTTWTNTTVALNGYPNDAAYNYTHLGLTTDNKSVPTIVATSGAQLANTNNTYFLACNVVVIKKDQNYGYTHSAIATGWTFKTLYTTNSSTLTQIQVSIVRDKDGYLHVVWLGFDSTVNTLYNVWYARSKDDGATWDIINKITSQTSGQHNYPTISVDKYNKVVITFAWLNPSGYGKYQIYQMISTNRGITWGQPTVIAAAANAHYNYPSVLYDPTFTVSFGDIAPIMYEQTAGGIYFKGSVITNNVPSLTITSPTNNQTLYENDTINLSGDAYDSDKDQSVTVFYEINGEQRKVLATNVSQTQITLSKQLTFKDGKLYDGETALTGTLAEGVAHTLKVWAVDSENSQSATIERTFYVVPNRAPLLSVDAVVPAGVVDTDKFKISGTSSDPDANANVKITKKVNANNPVEIYNGPGGAWEFDVSLAELVVGENTIVIEVIDNYGAKTSKTIKLKKNEIKTPILHAVARYKITPPAGSAKGVLLFIERDEDMDLTVELSMTLIGEQEQYETLTANNTAPMPNTNGIVEDTFYYEATEPKDNIILKISTTRPDATVNHKIHLLSGAVE